jgi:hypothetical protein
MLDRYYRTSRWKPANIIRLFLVCNFLQARLVHDISSGRSGFLGSSRRYQTRDYILKATIERCKAALTWLGLYKTYSSQIDMAGFALKSPVLPAHWTQPRRPYAPYLLARALDQMRVMRHNDDAAVE